MNANQDKDHIIDLLVKKQLMRHVVKSNLAKKGDRIRYSELLGITVQDIRDYFEQHGYPVIKDKDSSPLTSSGEYETIWTLDDGVYRAVWLERGTFTTMFFTKSRDEFQTWWNEHLISEYKHEIEYPWTV